MMPAASTFVRDEAGRARTTWLTSADTLRQRLGLAQKYQLGGT